MIGTRASRSIFGRLGVLVCALALAGCNRPPSSPHDALDGVEPLRAQFNRDAADTRIVLLAAPT